MNPGDLLFVFRNTLHYIVPMPTTGKVGYFLVSLNRYDDGAVFAEGDRAKWHRRVLGSSQRLCRLERTRVMNCSRSVGIIALPLCVLVLGLAPSRLDAQAKLTKNLFSHVMKSADVDAQFAKIQDSWDVYTKTNHAVTFRVSTKKLPATNHRRPTSTGSYGRARRT